jgi:two-component system LytT family response regulator
MKALKSISSPDTEALILRPDISFVQAMKAAGKIIFSVPGCTRYLHPDDILYIKAESNYTDVYFVQGQKLTLSKTLKDLEGELPVHIFFRVHRGYCVNIRHVIQLNNNADGCSVILTNKAEIPVSRDKKSLFNK